MVEQGQLQRVGLDEGLDLRGAQRGDPIQLGGAQLIADARAGEHAAVPDQADPGEPEAFFELGDLGAQGFRVGGVAVEHLDRYRYPGGATQQPVDDLRPAFDPVAGVPDLAQRAGVALKRRRGHVVEHQGAVGQMPCGQLGFDGVLALKHPVHRRIEVILITAGHAQHVTERAGRGLRTQPARHRQLGAWVDHLGHQHGGHQIPPPRGRRVDQLLHAECPRGAQHRGHVPVRQAAGDLERLGQLHRWRQSLKHPR